MEIWNGEQMKFKNWTIDDLIEWLINMKTSDLVDCHRLKFCRGEIEIYNGKRKEVSE